MGCTRKTHLFHIEVKYDLILYDLPGFCVPCANALTA
jgi:hypothetical protein